MLCKLSNTIKITISYYILEQSTAKTIFPYSVACIGRDSVFSVWTGGISREIKKGKRDYEFQFLTVALRGCART